MATIFLVQCWHQMLAIILVAGGIMKQNIQSCFALEYVALGDKGNSELTLVLEPPYSTNFLSSSPPSSLLFFKTLFT